MEMWLAQFQSELLIDQYISGGEGPRLRPPSGPSGLVVAIGWVATRSASAFDRLARWADGDDRPGYGSLVRG